MAAYSLEDIPTYDTSESEIEDTLYTKRLRLTSNRAEHSMSLTTCMSIEESYCPPEPQRGGFQLRTHLTEAQHLKEDSLEKLCSYATPKSNMHAQSLSKVSPRLNQNKIDHQSSSDEDDSGEIEVMHEQYMSKNPKKYHSSLRRIRRKQKQRTMRCQGRR